MMELRRTPLLRDVAVPGGSVSRSWQGEIGNLGYGIEVSELALDQNPTASRLRQVWTARRAGQARPVIVFAALNANEVLICGPDGTPPPVATLPTHLAAQVFETILAEPPIAASRMAIEIIGRAQGSGAVPGFRNRNLVSTHYVTIVIKREHSRDWTDAAAQGEEAIGTAGEALLRALGYRLESTGPKEYRIEDAGMAVAVAHVYDDGTSLDRVGPGQAAPPSAIALKRARELGLNHALLVAGSLLRIYSLKGERTLDEGAASAAYVEFDTRLLPADWAPLLGALAAPDALRPGGRLERLRAGSGRFAVGLRERFTKRLYEEVVDLLVRGIDDAAKAADLDTRPNEQELYRATLVLLFRLLFLLYAEDRDLLPMSNSEYAINSITRKVQAAAAIARDPARRFDGRATSLWTDLLQLFDAVSQGNADWGVPPYDGGLFARKNGLDDGLLARIALPNSVLGPALYKLGWDDEGAHGEVGKIDFGDLGVRHIGTIYEGLLSYEVAFATQNLRIDRRAEGEPYVPAGPGEAVDVPVGAPHVRSPQGGRKATGSYYTPVFAVDRLVDKALRPAIEAHIAQAGAELDLPTEKLFDFRVADIAMGSGHFLVAALDALTERYAAYLAAHPNKLLRAELDRARERLNLVGQDYGAPQLGDRVADVDLLRRIVLKRCIYGVDMNPMAVELARLGLWLHSLVPALPLSYLGANLKRGNSLVGASPAPYGSGSTVGMFDDEVARRAAALAAQLGSVTDLDLGAVQESRALEQEIESQTAGFRRFLNLGPLGPLLSGQYRTAQLYADAITRGLPLPHHVDTTVQQAAVLGAQLDAFHWTVEFPQLFVRDNPGFDVILGNPPWEKAKVERDTFFVRHIPGLGSVRDHGEREQTISDYETQNPAVAARYRTDSDRMHDLRTLLVYSYNQVHGSDPDLYKAFLERFTQLTRSGGQIGVVLPRAALSGDATQPFRDWMLRHSSLVDVETITNSGNWLFRDVDGRYTVALLALTLRPRSTNGAREVSATVLRLVGPARSAAELIDAAEHPIEWSSDELRRSDPSLSLPLLPNLAVARLYRRLVAEVPPLSVRNGSWDFFPWAELHGTNDRKSGLLKLPGAGSGWPVLKGDCFDIWHPDLQLAPLVLDPAVGLPHLQRKRDRSRTWSDHVSPDVIRNPDTLPMLRARILFRDVTRATDSRTVRACLIAPHQFASENSPSLVRARGDSRDEAFILGILCSIPFDWLARRRVENHLKYYILERLPVPRPGRSDPRWQRLVRLAARLASVDGRYETFAQSTGVNFGPLDDTEKDAMVAELDAVAAHLFGVSRTDVELMFEDFPSSEAGVSPGRRAAVLEFFTQWS